jgi:hypothetical protein
MIYGVDFVGLQQAHTDAMKKVDELNELIERIKMKDLKETH